MNKSCKRGLVLLTVVMLLLLSSNCETQWITWQKTYGAQLDVDEGYCIVQTPDSGYIAGGRKRMNSVEHMYIFRMNKFGELIWERIFPYDQAWKILRTNDNNYVAMGVFTNLVKLNINGDTLWKKGPFDFNKSFTAIKETNNGGFIICGTNYLNFRNYPYLLRIGTSGDSLWERTYTNGIFEGRFTDIICTAGGNYAASANISDSSFITNKLTITKIDLNGNFIWFRRYDTLRNHSTMSIEQNDDGKFMIGGGGPPFISQFDSLGNIQWLKKYDITTNSSCWTAIKTFDGNYVYTGSWDSTGNADFYMRLRKVDNNGIEIWRKSFGFSQAEFGTGIVQSFDSGYAIAGRTAYGGNNRQDVYIVKTDVNGNASPYIGIEPISNIIPLNFKLPQNYPNPFNPSTSIRFDIPIAGKITMNVYDILGRAVYSLSEHKTAGSYELKFDGSNLASGMYIYSIEVFQDGSSTAKFRDTKKMVLLK